MLKLTLSKLFIFRPENANISLTKGMYNANMVTLTHNLEFSTVLCYDMLRHDVGDSAPVYIYIQNVRFDIKLF